MRQPGPSPSAALVAVCLAACAREPSGPTGLAQEVSSGSLAIVSVSIPPRVQPGRTLAVSITVRNTGSTTWSAGGVQLVYGGDAGFSGATLTLGTQTRPNATAVFSGSLGAPTQIGLFSLAWTATDAKGTFGPAIAGGTEVTCSDGIFCNGDERYVNGACVAGPPPCDDGVACTIDHCDETTKRCWFELTPGCLSCASKNCNPRCNGKVCGDDGCGGSCGTCAPGLSCLAGSCGTATAPGTCANPLPLLKPGEPFFGLHTITGDTSTGINEVVPKCNSSSASKELIYSFVVPAGGSVGIDARMTGYDTVLHLRKDNCQNIDSTVACSDDASPPGGVGSRVALLLGPGTYYLIADGYSTSQVGPFTLTVNLVNGCAPNCDGRYCGDDGCGGACGNCGAGQACNVLGRCIASPCTPSCNGRKCGDDGCGGSCGTCASGELCVTATGACKAFPDCDHEKPVCKTACASTQYCGSDCQCHRNIDPRPDLVLDRDKLANEILFETRTFSDTSCAITERCVAGPGPRRLLRFTVEAVNQGQAAFTVPDPKGRPDLFEYSPCHGHYHFKGFASYALLDSAGRVLVTGRKQAYCMEDSRQVLLGPNVACNPKSTCDSQGIQAGWSDIYGNVLDCQWLDITGVAAGDYQLTVTVNPSRLLEEGSFDNNTSTVPVTIPP